MADEDRARVRLALVSEPWTVSSLEALGFHPLPPAYAADKARVWRGFLAWATATGRDPIPSDPETASRLLVAFLVSLRSRSAVHKAQSGVPATWALLDAPGADQKWRVDLHNKSLGAAATPRRDRRFDPLWDAVAARRAAFAPLLTQASEDLSFQQIRRALVAVLKCSSALARHTDAAAMTGEIIALDADRRDIDVPCADALGDCVALKLTSACSDKASAAANVAVRAEFLVLADEDEATCPVRALLRCVVHPSFHLRRDAAEADRLLLSINPTRGTYRPISADTVKRDLLVTLASIGVHQKDAAALARAAAANSLLSGGFSGVQVRALGRWSPGSSVFEKHYYKLGLSKIVSAGAAAESCADEL